MKLTQRTKEIYAKVVAWIKLILQHIIPCTKAAYGKAREFVKRPISISKFSMILSLYTLVVFHIPVLKVVWEGVDFDFSGMVIFFSFLTLLFVLNYFVYYLFLYIGRIGGKILLALTFVGNAICFYFINTYNVLITEEMMGNVFNTRSGEAFSFFSFTMVLYIIFLGVLPCIYIFMAKVEYGSIWRMLKNTLITVATVGVIAFANRQNILWIDYNATQIGSMLMPWSYTVNSVRYYNFWKMMNREEIKIEDAAITTEGKDVVVLVIGESARKANFSLYGYERNTNPKLQQDSVTALTAESAFTYTTAGVKAIIDHKPVSELYELLPNYLYRTGVDVVWRSNNWGQPPLHIAKYYSMEDLKELFPEADASYDGILFEELDEQILRSLKAHNKVFIVLHTSISHGPKYYQKYPAEFEEWTPVCTTVEMSKAKRQHLINAYDNTILYTDHLLHSVIEQLRELPEDVRSCMLFVSDHGESLGESGMYMHGMPKSSAPAYQYEIPFIVWRSDNAPAIKELDMVGQYHVFHSVLNFLGVYSPVYNEDMNIFDNPAPIAPTTDEEVTKTEPEQEVLPNICLQ